MRHAHSNNPPSSAPSTAHRDKRTFQQSSITSFFARETSDSEDEYWEERGSGPITRQHYARERVQRESVVPNVPGSVQADLLSVGMRVRKSVPEGYKTHKSANLPSIQTTLSKGGPLTNSTMGTGDAYSVKIAGPEIYQHQRELLPFSGLHKIGGYAEQPVTNVHLYGGTDKNGDRPVNIFPLPAAAFNQPFSSQDSTNSDFPVVSIQAPNPTNLHKRSWQDEDIQPLNLNSNFLFALPMKVSEDEVPISPHSATPAPSVLSLPQSALRPFAQPKTRRQHVGRMDVDNIMFKESDMDVDSENAEEGTSNDFVEADFLRPWNGREVAMGGV
ncbi:hypothetical protein K504DRAFT_457812 [Pleomassaria siparia CBS 279.74]|uniref:Uncharacterized protein n=1 Tax=Pleomassaria siparia CBS 279.74 TaxID=1314801 RepID=A0A6G1KTE4_9PLEO|nr:hypothetical protein K504DRAFT_457812 [Pleomassaria siparia CBS 279.74]